MDEENRMDLKPEPQHLLQHEFSVIVFLDFLCERPFDLIYQEKTIQQYQANIIAELVSIRNEIRDSWVDNRIDDGITQILMKTQKIAADHGYTQSLRKQSMKYLLPLMIGLFALSFVLIFFLGDLFPEEYYWLMYVIYAGLLLVICIVPRLINQRLLKRWQDFGEINGPLIKKGIVELTERIQKFIQFLIDDVRKILDTNNMDFANYRLMLFNPNYENVKIIQEEFRKNVKFYIMELLPFETESKPAEINEETYDDEFESFEP